MSPDERALGEVAGTVKALGTQLTEFQRSTERAHERLNGRLGSIEDSMRKDLARKANTREIEAHEERIDSLESDRDKRAGAVQLVRVAQGFILAAASIGGYVIAGGHV